MLTAGMVPALYEESEKDGIVGNIRDEAVKRGTLDAKDVAGLVDERKNTETGEVRFALDKTTKNRQ